MEITYFESNKSIFRIFPEVDKIRRNNFFTEENGQRKTLFVFDLGEKSFFRVISTQKIQNWVFIVVTMMQKLQK